MYSFQLDLLLYIVSFSESIFFKFHNTFIFVVSYMISLRSYTLSNQNMIWVHSIESRIEITLGN